MKSYGELYAHDFTGVKRVGDRASEMDRAAWLKDRRELSLKTPRVDISDLRFFAKDDLVIAEFRQKWSTDTFADEGTKVLTLRKRNGSWEIVREAMLASRVLSPEERARAPELGGHCERLGRYLDQPEHADELWRFADVSGALGPVKWTRVTSWDEAQSKSPTGDVWISATVVSDGKWLLAYTSYFSPSGDSAILTEECYRPNGNLARLQDAFRRFSARGLAEDVRVAMFDAHGNAGWSTRRTSLLETGEPLHPDELMGQADSKPFEHVTTLPYFTLLPDEVRKRYAKRPASP